MKGAIIKIFLIIFATTVLTTLSFFLLAVLIAIGMNEVISVFIIIEFTIIIGTITICYFMRKWTNKGSEKDGNEKKEQ